MPRTPAQIEAAKRDGQYCLWSKYGAPEPSLIPVSDVHHLARRQPGADLPQLCISLSHEVHMNHHNGREPTTAQLLDLMQMIYGWDLRKDFPLLLGGY